VSRNRRPAQKSAGAQPAGTRPAAARSLGERLAGTELTPETLGRALLPLRAFLGFTFCFAGLQKLANPGFFTAGNPASIQSQLAGAARRSPIHVLISPLTHVAVPLGILIAFAELAIGVGTLLGLWQRLAAAGGVALSLMLWLTVSFHSSPYYTGADIVFVFAWTPLLLAGAGPVLSVDAALAARAAEPRGGREASRRDVVVKGTVTAVVAAASLVTGGVTAALGRLAGGTSKTGTTALSPATPSAGASSSSPAAQAGPKSATGHPPGKAIGPASAVPAGQAGTFSDPATGNPSIVIHPKAATFVAFDAVCPHAGCTVQYDPSQSLIVCPCHGSQFSASTGAVEVGPAVTGLGKLAIAEGQDGQLYVS
jgi:thiosulfate dehydrogenase [quinone] large subunit